jgi:methyl-accepting chemotaxis protein
MIFRRKKYLINFRHQLKYIVTFIGVAIFSFIFSTSEYIHDMSVGVDKLINSENVEISSTGEIVLPIVLEVSLKTTLIISAVLAILILLYYISVRKLSDSLCKALQKLKTGDLGVRLDVPGGDFQDTEKSFNDMVAVNRGKIETIKQAVDKLDCVLDSAIIEAEAGGGIGSERKREIQSGLSQINSIMSGYEVK